MRFHFDLWDLIDILVVAILMYKVHKMLRNSSANRVFIGILIFIVAWWLVNNLFGMQLLGTIMNQVMNVGAIALIVLFQDELRNFLSMLGSRDNFILRFMRKFMPQADERIEESAAMQIVIACRNMAKGKVGALICIRRKDDIKSIEVTGETLNAVISTRLIENIFFKNSPLHDGAMVISDGKISSAGCILPVSHSVSIPKECGLRHRAALGISETTDVAVVVVSEETGNISIARNGKLKINITPKELEAFLYNDEENIKWTVD